VSSSGDLAIAANGKKVLKTPTKDGAESVEVTLYYRLVNDEVHSLLKLSEPIWSQKFFIATKSISLK
jgi:hypothetical protein